MKTPSGWLKRRFYDFRHGHSTYLAFALSFINFIVLNYRLLIANVKYLTDVFPHLWVFGGVFIITYLPLATFIGYKFYRKNQLRVDQEIALKENPFMYKAQPGKESILYLPANYLSWQLQLKLFKAVDRLCKQLSVDMEPILTKEEEQEIRKFIVLIGKLIEGESLRDE